MGLFDFITDLFSKPGKGKPKKKKKAAKKKAVTKGRAQKELKQKGDATDLKVSKKKPPKKKKKKQSESSGILPFSLDAKKGKKRKKSKKISSDPIDEQSLGFSISLKGEASQAKKREAVRISVEGLVVFVHRLKKKFKVTDISATGLGFEFEKPRMKGGIKLKMDLYLDGKAKATEVECKVMRHDRGSVGCIFVELDRAQDDAVHELVLLGQKQQVDKKTAQKDREFVLPD